jgi:Ca-activated chloride channel family protein
MTFEWPGMLWLLAAIPVAVIAYILMLRGRDSSALRYSALSLAKEALGRRGKLRRHIPPALLLFALASMIVAVARPSAKVSLPSSRGMVILAMDISGSMRARDVLPSRFEAMKDAAREFVKGQPPGVKIGIVAFAATATLVQPPSADRDASLAAIDRFQTQRGTAVGSGILTSLAAIFEGTNVVLTPLEPGFGGAAAGGAGPGDAGTDSAPGDLRGTSLDQASPQPAAPPPPAEPGSYKAAAVILLTDGQTNAGPDPIEAARRSADLGVRVFTVGLGTTKGQVLGYGGWSMRAQLDEASLKTIADLTRGKYFKASSGGDLREIYRQLGSQISLERGVTEITALLTALAIAFVLASALLSMLWFRRVL